MWDDLSVENKKEYQRLILAFASLTTMFKQKSKGGDDYIPSPVINSKFQETVFQRVFQANAEDIGNTSYDASICLESDDGKQSKYLVGIKTFGFITDTQKVAQFKTNHNEWANLIDKMEKNAHDEYNKLRNKKEINKFNHDLYLDLAKKVACLRNKRIESSQENLRGFKLGKNDKVDCIYHVLMPSKKNNKPQIHVGEISYNKIDIENINIIGCTSAKTPTNFDFNDGIHTYRFTSADSQLLMKFNNKKIIVENWDVVYADNAYEIFSDIANKIYGICEKNKDIESIKTESYSWSILNNKNEVELFSGFNSFFGVGLKKGIAERKTRLKIMYRKYRTMENFLPLIKLFRLLCDYSFSEKRNTEKERMRKKYLREEIIRRAEDLQIAGLKNDIFSYMYRPVNEMYIPIPNSKKFHEKHPDFFGKDIVAFKTDGKTGKKDYVYPKEKRRFNMIFEPSGDSLECFITQDDGKGIQSYSKQSKMGEWILRKIFQLDEYEPLTRKRLEEIGINGIRLYKKSKNEDIHLEFIWIDFDDLPDDYIDYSAV